MAFQVSPGVLTNEIDLTTIVPSVSSTEGAISGPFRWGPLEQTVLIDSENTLLSRFGKPTNFNAETWFVAASFLGYGSALHVSRAANTQGASPIVTVTANSGNATVITTNTADLATGMIMIASNNSNFRVGTTISAITNSTAFVIAAGSDAVTNGAASVQFVSNTSAFTSFVNTASVSNLSGQVVKNENDFTTVDGTFDPDVLYVARYPGKMGDSIRVSQCDTAAGFTSSLNLASFSSGATISINVGSNTAAVIIVNNHDGSSNTGAQTAVETSATSLKGAFAVTDFLQFGNNSNGTQSLKVTAKGDTTSTVNGTVAMASFTINFEDELRLIDDQTANTSITRFWEFYDLMDVAPGQSDFVRASGNTSANDELHTVIVDKDGLFTGVPGTVLEAYKALSRATNAKNLDNGTNYYKEVINQSSRYVWLTRDRSTALSNTAANVTSATNNAIFAADFNYGQDGSDESNIALSVLTNGFDLFASPQDVDISLVMQGKARGGTAGGQLANYLIDNLTEARKDCVLFVSPERADAVNNYGDESTDMVVFRNTLRSTSYAVMDSGYKYMYDKYNDTYRWIPMNGDIAGLCARTDTTNDPWWSIAGFNRGQIKNIAKLAYNPGQADRDILYKAGINPVVTFPGQGTILYGDKTLLAKPSAFDRINVRRLFIVLRKAISRAAQYTLFEFNDDFTRARFRNIITPYLRDVQGRRGITDFVVVCDSSNNTGEVIDRNEFVGDIYIKPARSINFIKLNFVAVRTDVSFNEVIGKF